MTTRCRRGAAGPGSLVRQERDARNLKAYADLVRADVRETIATLRRTLDRATDRISNIDSCELAQIFPDIAGRRRAARV